MYQLEARNMVRTGKMVYLCLLNLQYGEEEAPTEQDIEYRMQELRESIANNLRAGDCFCRYSTTQFILLLPASTYDVGNLVMKRINSDYKSRGNCQDAIIEWELVPVEPVTVK